MSNAEIAIKIRDNGGRRAGIDRRCYSYSEHIPERRCGVDRRSKEGTNQDRRKVWDMMHSRKAQN